MKDESTLAANWFRNDNATVKPENTNGNTTLDKEIIVELIKAVFKGEFQKQQKDISKIISNNLTIAKQETGKIIEDNNNPKKSIEFTENVLEHKVSKVKKNFCKLKKKVTKVEEDLTYVNDLIGDRENIKTMFFFLIIFFLH